ncbi:hypothetical protein [Marinobacter sp.]|nr:hypothetical protein [Marinobacter sp.]
MSKFIVEIEFNQTYEQPLNGVLMKEENDMELDFDESVVIPSNN